jgi:membrane-bound lytic murein transglycosylase A
VYAPPDDLLVVDLGELYPELKDKRVRARVEGRRVVPYYPRADIEAGRAKTSGKEIAWVEDAVDLFFLQIQGSGRIRLPDGSTLRVGYADQNGHPYRSVGRVLVERGELTVEQASMAGIKQWVIRNPDRAAALLNENPSYVFFRELPTNPPGSPDGPLGALGVALSAGRSVAVDKTMIPLGTPLFLSTTHPGNGAPLQRLVIAQDTGGAIRGPIRIDLFWGFGEDAGREAGRMRQPGQVWMLWPNGVQLPNALPTA